MLDKNRVPPAYKPGALRVHLYSGTYTQSIHRGDSVVKAGSLYEAPESSAMQQSAAVEDRSEQALETVVILDFGAQYAQLIARPVGRNRATKSGGIHPDRRTRVLHRGRRAAYRAGGPR